jgi:hypothetical protein
MTLARGFPYDRIRADGTKRQLTRTDVVVRLADALWKHERDTFNLVFGRSGILPLMPTGLDLVAGALGDSFSLTQGIGLIFRFDDSPPIVENLSAASHITENLLGQTYHIGARLQRCPSMTAESVGANPRTGAIEYLVDRMWIGELAHPNSVIDNGDGSVDLVCTTLLQAGGTLRNHGDRSVLVWLDAPASPDFAVAFQAGTAVYDPAGGGSYGIASLPNMGQAAGLVSTDPADYWLLLPGWTVTTLDISAVSHYLYLGSFAGAGVAPLSDVPIGAIDTTAVYRFGSTLGTIDADVWTLYRDLYTAPSRDGDGLANLATPIETHVTRLVHLPPRWSRGVLSIMSDPVSQPIPLLGLGSIDPKAIIVAPFWISTGLVAEPTRYVDISAEQAVPDNKTSIITYDIGAGTFGFHEAGVSWPAQDEIYLGVVKTDAAGNISWLHPFPQRATFGNAGQWRTGLRVSKGSTATAIRLTPGRIGQANGEWVSPLIVELDHNDTDFWTTGVVDAAAGWRYLYAFGNLAGDNRVYLRIVSGAQRVPGPDGLMPGTNPVAASDPSWIYLGSVYWDGANVYPSYQVSPGETVYSYTRSALFGGTDTSVALVDLSALVPPQATAVTVLLNINPQDATADIRFLVGPDSALTTEYLVEDLNVTGLPRPSLRVERKIPLLVPQAIYYKRVLPGAPGNTTSLDIDIIGWSEDDAHPVPMGGTAYFDTVVALAS